MSIKREKIIINNVGDRWVGGASQNLGKKEKEYMFV